MVMSVHAQQMVLVPPIIFAPRNIDSNCRCCHQDSKWKGRRLFNLVLHCIFILFNRSPTIADWFMCKQYEKKKNVMMNRMMWKHSAIKVLKMWINKARRETEFEKESREIGRLSKCGFKSAINNESCVAAIPHFSSPKTAYLLNSIWTHCVPMKAGSMSYFSEKWD